jgi:ABC-type glutathione transport system ATPase component
LTATGKSTERGAPTGWRRGWSAGDHPVTIDVDGVSKSFRIPSHRIDSLKERVVHPFTRVAYRELQALHDVTFDVRRGEFFGIVGRNGSGKSTLLKLPERQGERGAQRGDDGALPARCQEAAR